MAYLPPAPHEKREQWMTGISGSIHWRTVFHEAESRWRQLDKLLEHNGLGWDLWKLQRYGQDLWAMPRLTKFWNEVMKSIRIMKDEYITILLWLRDQKWDDPDCREEKELMIKTLVVYDYYITVILKTYFEHLRRLQYPFFIKYPPQLQVAGRQARRWSIGANVEQQGLYTEETLRNRFRIEQRTLKYTSDLGNQYVQALAETSGKYDSGELFELYVDDMRTEYEIEKRVYARQGEPYPLHHFRFMRPLGASGFEKDHWNHHEPLKGVPCWQEDNDVHQLFSPLSLRK